MHGMDGYPLVPMADEDIHSFIFIKKSVLTLFVYPIRHTCKQMKKGGFV